MSISMSSTSFLAGNNKVGLMSCPSFACLKWCGFDQNIVEITRLMACVGFKLQIRLK